MSHNLIKRIITSTILLSLLIFINFSSKYIFILSILTLSIIICFEANNLFAKFLITKHSKKKNLINKFNYKFLLLNVLTFCYVFFIFCNLSYKIFVSENSILFLYIISICFFTDIGGFVIGKSVGGKKLSKISPNKTVSGTIGSFIFSIFPLILTLNFSYLDLEINAKNLIFCLSISFISQLGDLFVSYIKRKAKVKDTGKLLPGHGGVLDRVDGIIFAVPFSYLLLGLN
jgi:phosphatidate cytidylyltransferase